MSVEMMGRFRKFDPSAPTVRHASIPRLLFFGIVQY